MSIVYEKIKKTQNETKHNKMSEMQTAGKKQRSTMDNIVIVSAIIEQRRIEKRNTYAFLADAVKFLTSYGYKTANRTSKIRL